MDPSASDLKAEKSKKKKREKEREEEEEQEGLERKRDKKEKKKEAERAYKEKRDQEIRDVDRAIQRNVARNILQNKGLTRKRKKEMRNPRVHKRMKYEKALKARKTMVQEFKGGKQPLYGGEASGLKMG